ncbi:MAG TPA: BTAD domain-containing putative transcriptional regulator [Solirubrobacteraceae bacterium]
MIEFRILGPFEVVEGERPVGLGGLKQRTLLAVLLLHRGEVVSTDRLIDAMWGERASPTAAKTVQVYVSNLRKALGDGLLVTRGRGYLLQIDASRVDVDRFEALVGEGRAASRAGDPKRAGARLREALGLWRGPPLSEFAYEQFSQSEISRLEEERLTVLEDRIDADLALGEHVALVGELEGLVRDHPLRERLHGELMLALYRSGRQADALAHYRQTQTRLAEELGLDPGGDLRALEQAILTQDPSLDLPRAPGTGHVAPTPASGKALRPPLAARVPAWRLLAAGGALAVLVAAMLVVLVASGGNPGIATVAANSVAVIDAATGRLVAQVPVGTRPSQLSLDDGALWVANLGDGTFSEIDLRTRQVVRTLAPATTAATTIAGVTVASGAIWTLDSTAVVRRVDLRNDSVSSASVGGRFDPYWALGPDTVASGAGGVWALTGRSSVARLDPLTGHVVNDIALGTFPTSIAIGGGAVWVSDSADGTVSRIDPLSDAVTSIPVGRGASGIAVGANGLWVANTLDNTVTRIDPVTGVATDTIRVGAGPRGVAFGAGAIWVANSRDGTLSRIDPATRRVIATIELGQSPEDVAIRGGSVLVSVQPGGVGSGPARGGLKLRILAETDPLQSTDPAIGASDPVLGGQLTYLTCAPLLNYPDRPAAAGQELIPDVARSLPRISDGGRVYTFDLRPGVRFSPPSDAPVTAKAFGRAIERALNPTMASPWAFEVQDIVGAKAYTAGRAATVAGVTASGLRLTIRLTAPQPDFPSRIATQGFCAVPPDTPINPNGVEGIPQAGPYYVAEHVPNQTLVLKRSPTYRGPGPGAVSEIDVAIGVAGDRAMRQVLSGAADYTEVVPLGAVGFLSTRYGPASAAARAGGERYFEAPTLGFQYLVLNARRPLFSHVNLRQAVNYAIDRRTLAAAANDADPIHGYQPTAAYLQPGLPGYEPAAIYPLGGPDVARASRLTGDTHRHGTIYGYTLPPGPELAQIVKTDLAAIGIDMDIKLFGKVAMYNRLRNPNEPWDIALAGWGIDHPDPSDEINTLFDSSSIPPAAPVPNSGNLYFNLGAFSDPYFDRRMRAAASLTGAARERAYQQLAIDLARDASPVAAWSVPVTRNLFAGRIGCQTYQPIYGFDLATLCRRQARRP